MFILELFSQNRIFFSYDDSDESTIISSDIKELKYDIKSQEYYFFDFAREYEGSLDSALHYLFNISKARIKINGKVPAKNIYFKSIDFYYHLPFDHKEIAIEMFKKRYNFEADTCKELSEVWVLDVKNWDLLNSFKSADTSNFWAGSCGMKNSVENGITYQYYDMNNCPINFLAEFIEKTSNNIVYTFDDTTRYTFQIPSKIFYGNYSILNDFLEKKLGLTLKKEQKEEKFIYITFKN